MQTTKQARRRAAAAPAVARKAAKRIAASPAKASSPDMTLVAAGLALVVLVLAETGFLALSTRLLAG